MKKSKIYSFLIYIIVVISLIFFFYIGIHSVLAEPIPLSVQFEICADYNISAVPCVEIFETIQPYTENNCTNETIFFYNQSFYYNQTIIENHTYYVNQTTLTECSELSDFEIKKAEWEHLENMEKIKNEAICPPVQECPSIEGITQQQCDEKIADAINQLHQDYENQIIEKPREDNFLWYILAGAAVILLFVFKDKFKKKEEPPYIPEERYTPPSSQVSPRLFSPPARRSPMNNEEHDGQEK